MVLTILRFGFLKVSILHFNTFFFFFVNIEPNGSESFKTLNSSYKSQATVFKLDLNFLPTYGPHRATLGIFVILSSDF